MSLFLLKLGYRFAKERFNIESVPEFYKYKIKKYHLVPCIIKYYVVSSL